MEYYLRGRVWKFGRGISTDHIIAAKYLDTVDAQVFAAHAMETVDPDFPKKVRPGDLIVAGPNFGCGSSREQAPMALKALGIQAIVAESFARIFFRNSINIGLPLVECPDVSKSVEEGDHIEVDLTRGILRTADGQELRTTAFPPRVLEILEAGGLIPKLKQESRARSAGASEGS